MRQALRPLPIKQGRTYRGWRLRQAGANLRARELEKQLFHWWDLLNNSTLSGSYEYQSEAAEVHFYAYLIRHRWMLGALPQWAKHYEDIDNASEHPEWGPYIATAVERVGEEFA